jgi:hypothetical protein
MAALESPDYQIARGQIKGNPVITKMAAGVATVPLAELAHDYGTPRFEFMQRANRAFDEAGKRNAGNPCYQPYPADTPRHLGLIAEAVLAARAAIREAAASAMAAPGTPLAQAANFLPNPASPPASRPTAAHYPVDAGG